MNTCSTVLKAYLIKSSKQSKILMKAEYAKHVTWSAHSALHKGPIWGQVVFESHSQIVKYWHLGKPRRHFLMTWDNHLDL